MNELKGGNPLATLVPNSMIVVGVLYCVQPLFWGEQNIYIPLSNAKAFVS